MTDDLTLREAAKLLNVHRNTLHLWMRKRIIRYSQPGGRRGHHVFSRKWIAAWKKVMEAKRKSAEKQHKEKK